MTAVMMGAAGSMGGQVSLSRLSNVSQATFAATPQSVSAGIEFTSAGVVNELRGDGVSVPSTRTSLAPDYYPPGGTGLEVRLTVVSGSGPNGGSLSAGTWFALTSTRSCYQTLTGVGIQTRTGVWRFEIRRGTTVIATSADITVSCTLDA